MNYYVNQGPKHIANFATEKGAKEYVLRQIESWQFAGCAEHPAYTVYYQPSGTVIGTWPAKLFNQPTP